MEKAIKLGIMEKIYQQVIDFVVDSGKELVKKSGKAKDIGVTKKYLTEEDLKIERGLNKIITKFDKSHKVFAEEEHFDFKEAENIWVIDPISMTRAFIKGLPHYAIVVAHTQNKKVKFSVVYDPSMNDLYYAFDGGGFFHNGQKIKPLRSEPKKNLKIIFNLSVAWLENKEIRKNLFQELTQFDLYRNTSSFGLNYCYVACGYYDGFVALTKDNFPEIAGSLMIKESGGSFVNLGKLDLLQPEKLIFYGGNDQTFSKLDEIFSKINYL